MKECIPGLLDNLLSKLLTILWSIIYIMFTDSYPYASVFFWSIFIFCLINLFRYRKYKIIFIPVLILMLPILGYMLIGVVGYLLSLITTLCNTINPMVKFVVLQFVLGISGGILLDLGLRKITTQKAFIHR